jgi:hypothetical protein
MQTSPHQENEAVKSLLARMDAFERRDWTAFRWAIADDCNIEDRRSGVAGLRAGTQDDAINSWKNFADLGFDRVELDPPIATRGRCMALMRGVLMGSHGFEVCAIELSVTNADGRVGFIAYFDDEDVQAALTELDNQERLRGTSL